jgi:GNAT superfamily N-acetyltransferase
MVAMTRDPGSPVELREVTPADPIRFAEWHRTLAAGTLESRPFATMSSLAEFTYSLSSPSPVKHRRACGAFLAESCVGALLYETPLMSDLEVALVDIAVPKEERNQGVGARLWSWARRLAELDGRTIFQGEVHIPLGQSLDAWPGSRFAMARDFVSQNVEDHLVATLPFSPSLLEELSSSAPARDGYLVVSWSGPCPAQYEEAMAELHTAMSSDAPVGEVTREAVVFTVDRLRLQETRLARNWLSMTSMALTATGAGVGYSTLLLPYGQPEHALQDDTLVLHSHRGRGLGVALKVANLLRVEELPTADTSARRWLHTYTQRGNGAMQHVNARFGFRPVEQMHELEMQLVKE